MPAMDLFHRNRLNSYFIRFRKWLTFLSSPHKTALTLTLGFYLGLFPVFGSTTLLCLAAAFIFRLNHLMIQGMNLLLFPFQLMLMYPMLKAGRMLFFTRREILYIVPLHQWLHAGGWNSFLYLCKSMAGGILVWFLFSAITGFLFYRMIFRLTLYWRKHTQES